MSTRFFKNTLIDWTPNENLADALRQLEPETNEAIEELLKQVFENPDHDSSMYTGDAGFAYLSLFLAEKNSASENRFLEYGLLFVEKRMKRLRCNVRDMTFLCGDMGPLCLHAVLKLKTGKPKEAEASVQRVLNLMPEVLKPCSEMPNELLYGRVGYLFCLLYLQKYFPGVMSNVPVQQLAEVIIEQGRQKNLNHLMWEWHGKKYLGGAHGVAGIVYILLQVGNDFRPDHKSLLENTVNYLLSLRFPSGNLPSSVGSSDDRLVHWCHGAPGFVQTLLAAHQVWRKPEYLEAAEQCGQVVWERGLLKKGFGICHGVAGNAYTFLALYQATGHDKHLHRASQFARWCLEKKNGPEAGSPDRPLSLFEGFAGTAHFLIDIKNPAEAVFPCYSIRPFTKCV